MWVSTGAVPFLFIRTASLLQPSWYLGSGEVKYETLWKISRPTLRPHHSAKSHLGSSHPRRTNPTPQKPPPPPTKPPPFPPLREPPPPQPPPPPPQRSQLPSP